MAQVNDSQVNHPVITFRVNLVTPDREGQLLPYRTEAATGENEAESTNMKNTRTVWIPGLLAAENLGGRDSNGSKFKHGDEFTVKGQKAIYLKNLYVTGSKDDLLQIVSQS